MALASQLRLSTATEYCGKIILNQTVLKSKFFSKGISYEAVVLMNKWVMTWDFDRF